jgi:hypothetical protein
LQISDRSKGIKALCSAPVMNKFKTKTIRKFMKAEDILRKRDINLTACAQTNSGKRVCFDVVHFVAAVEEGASAYHAAPSSSEKNKDKESSTYGVLDFARKLTKLLVVHALSSIERVHDSGGGQMRRTEPITRTTVLLSIISSSSNIS